MNLLYVRVIEYNLSIARDDVVFLKCDVHLTVRALIVSTFVYRCTKLQCYITMRFSGKQNGDETVFIVALLITRVQLRIRKAKTYFYR